MKNSIVTGNKKVFQISVGVNEVKKRVEYLSIELQPRMFLLLLSKHVKFKERLIKKRSKRPVEQDYLLTRKTLTFYNNFTCSDIVIFFHSLYDFLEGFHLRKTNKIVQ